MAMTHDQLDIHDKEITALFRSWVEHLDGDCPYWMSTEEYELLHKGIREAMSIMRERGINPLLPREESINAPNRSS